MARATLYFPKDFLWGTATAAYQVEGRLTHSDWWVWEHTPGAILEGHTSGLACDWWRNAEQDLDLAAEMGTNAHRMSVDWSRIEPTPGHFDDDALGRYREILQAMRARGLEPMVTLHHFVNPLWLVEMGDFSQESIVARFQAFTAHVVAALGDLVPKWVTINEPMVYIVLRYLESAFPPPPQRGFGPGMTAVRNLLRCHAAAYHTIKEQYPQAMVGVAHQFRPILPPRHSLPGGRRWADYLARLFNDMFLEPMIDGRLRWPSGRETIPQLAGTLDFVGINYYTYSRAVFPPLPGKLYDNTYPPNAVVGDGNYGEVYPAGLYWAIHHALRYHKPIAITENGIPDHDDDQRPAFILQHLREVWRAISFNYPVLGYYHWSLIDNFEWERGWTQRFGLIALDVETQARTWRRSGELYRDICHLNGLSSELTERYAPQLLPILFPG